jgi:nickel-type superoxide dismutase maturation protease
MEPTLEPGDRLVVITSARLRSGQVVAVADPRGSGRLLVKRVESVRDGEVELLGDNPAASTDSRHFGAVRNDQVVGTALYRYFPPKRAGWLSG